MKTKCPSVRIFPLLLATIFFGNYVFAQDAVALYQEGVQLKNDKKSREALEKFRQAVAKNPNYTDAIYEMGWCQNDLKEYSAAITSLRSVRTTWNNVSKVFFELGYAFEKSAMLDSAIQSYNECLRINPTYSLVFKQLGTIAYNADKYKEALDHFANYELNAKSDIKDYLYWYRKGFMLNAQLEYNNAITALMRSLEFKTDYINTYLELGFSYNKLKKGDEAIAYYNKALAIDAKSHIPYNGIAEVYRDTKKDIDQAMTWYQKTLAVKTDERKACFGMGYCLNSKGKYADATTYLKKAILQESNYTAAYVELGYALYMQSKNTEALENLSKAISLNPKNENARYYSGLVYIQQGNRSMAQKMADELKSLNSKNAAALQTKVNAM